MKMQPIIIPHGEPETRWIHEIEDKYRCPKCGMITSVDEVMGKPVYEYCPYCGKSMTKKRNKP